MAMSHLLPATFPALALVKSRLKILSSIVNVLRVRRIHSLPAAFVAQLLSLGLTTPCFIMSSFLRIRGHALKFPCHIWQACCCCYSFVLIWYWEIHSSNCGYCWALPNLWLYDSILYLEDLDWMSLRTLVITHFGWVSISKFFSYSFFEYLW